ncbi:hypothetical protein [Methyloversatilis thermotolerans]|uniref:hypothetical protein n=1 Tax=Methyloversatilis thermotolerans TaxID=1346290 RepID=UPI000377E94C|nr:hypothetical protein [Methyloversatilis thermotolerans]
MLVLRLIGVLLIITVGASFVAYVLTRDTRYLQFAWRVLRYAVIATLGVLALFLLERVIVL